MSPRRRCDVVDATGTRRRLDALAAIGHSSTVVGTSMGRPVSSSRALVASWRRRDRRHIDARTAADVAQVYELLSRREGTCDIARIRARRNGCLPPAAWVGVDIDDPAATPNPEHQDDAA